MRAQALPKPMISVQVLGKMLRKLSAAELAKIPADTLPDQVPEFIYRNGTPEKNAVLEDLLIRRDTERMSRQVTDLERYGKQIADAFHYAESSAQPAVVREFLREVDALAALVDATQGGENGHGARIGEKCTLLRELLQRIRASSLLRGDSVLRALHGDSRGRDRRRVDQALSRLQHKLAPAAAALSRFHGLRIELAHREMSALRQCIRKEATNQDHLQAQIDALRAELSQRSSMWRRALGKYHASEDYAGKQEQIRQLISRKQLSQFVIDDEQLVAWLDAIVDASLECAGRQPVVHATRLHLLSLLELYCRQQEESAAQIARNPFSQIDPDQAVRFVLASERFILDYFAKKQEEGAVLFRTTAKSRRAHLDDLMKGIIKELQSNMRKLKV